MNECKKVRRLLALRPDEWSAVEQNRVKAHLTNCPNCAALAGQYVEQDRLIRAAPHISLTPSQRGQLLARIQQERRRHEMHIKLSTILSTATVIVVLTALALGLRVLLPQIGQSTVAEPSGPYPTDADEALWVHIDGAWDKDLAHRTTTVLQRQPWWDGEIILFTYEDNFPEVAGGGRQRVLSWVLAEPDDLEPRWAVITSGNREVAHWPTDQNVPIPANGVAYTFWLSERQYRQGRTLSVIYGPWADPGDVPETVQLVLNDQILDVPLENDSFLYFSEERLVEKRPEIRWACASPDGGLCGISLRTDEPRPGTEPLVFAGEIRYDGLTVDWLTGRPLPFTIGERDSTDPFAPGRLYIPSHVYWSLTWRVVAPPSADWRVFVHLYNEAGELTLQSDVAADWLAQPCPEDEYDPVKCTTITDEYEWVFPADFPPGLYTIKVGLYDPNTGERAPVTSPPGATSPVALGQVRVVSDKVTSTPVEPIKPTETLAPGESAETWVYVDLVEDWSQPEPYQGTTVTWVDMGSGAVHSVPAPGVSHQVVGEWVYYQEGSYAGTVHRVNAAGQDERFDFMDIPEDNHDLVDWAISPDGTQIVWKRGFFEQGEDYDVTLTSELYVGDIATGETRLLTTYVVDEHWHLAPWGFSPDSSQIFVYQQPFGVGTLFFTSGQLSVMDVATGQLTPLPDPVQQSLPGEAATLSDDGTRLARFGYVEGGGLEVSLTDLASGQTTEIASFSTDFTQGGNGMFSPDGSTLVYTVAYGDRGSETFALFQVDLITGRLSGARELLAPQPNPYKVARFEDDGSLLLTVDWWMGKRKGTFRLRPNGTLEHLSDLTFLGILQ